MPVHMVRDHIAEGRLKALDLRENVARTFPVHVVHERGRAPGKAGRWLIEDLRQRVKQCTKPLAALARINPAA
jgi:DNA-binding transcriptional LysR family regulator